MKVDLGVKPIPVLDEDGTVTDLYPDGVFFQYDKQGTLIKHNLKKKSSNGSFRKTNPRRVSSLVL